MAYDSDQVDKTLMRELYSLNPELKEKDKEAERRKNLKLIVPAKDSKW